MTSDFDLGRFLQAQEPVFASVRRELADGRKRSHWMWFIFPQLRELGRSSTAQFYGIVSLEEARAYLDHPLLGPRLRECTALVNATQGRTAHEIFGSPDDMKLHSSATLFALAAPDEVVFQTVLERFFNGVPDPRTIELLT